MADEVVDNVEVALDTVLDDLNEGTMTELTDVDTEAPMLEADNEETDAMAELRGIGTGKTNVPVGIDDEYVTYDDAETGVGSDGAGAKLDAGDGTSTLPEA